MKFSIKVRIWSHLLKKFLMGNFFFVQLKLVAALLLTLFYFQIVAYYGINIIRDECLF